MAKLQYFWLKIPFQYKLNYKLLHWPIGNTLKRLQAGSLYQENECYKVTDSLSLYTSQQLDSVINYGTDKLPVNDEPRRRPRSSQTGRQRGCCQGYNNTRENSSPTTEDCVSNACASQDALKLQAGRPPPQFSQFHQYGSRDAHERTSEHLQVLCNKCRHSIRLRQPNLRYKCQH